MKSRNLSSIFVERMTRLKKNKSFFIQRTKCPKLRELNVLIENISLVFIEFQ